MKAVLGAATGLFLGGWDAGRFIARLWSGTWRKRLRCAR